MKMIVWVLRLAVFLLVFWFAVRNMHRVTVDILGLMQWTSAPLILVMLSCFLLGTVFGILICLPTSIRHRRELYRLRKQVQAMPPEVGVVPVVLPAARVPDQPVGLSG